jgi:hypothetical protein
LCRGENYEDGESCQRARPHIPYQQTETDRHLDRCSPGHMEEATAEVYPRDISRDVIDQSAIGQRYPCTSSQAKGTRIDRRDETTPE